MLNIVLIGPQGSGKGTQAEKMVGRWYLTHVEAGAMIRERADKHDKKALIIDHLVNKKGELLPDGVVLDMIYDEIQENPTDTGYLFDGFPRTTQQYMALKEMLGNQGIALTHGVYLHISDEEAVKRLSTRRLCRDCHKGYSLALEPERVGCDCGGKLVKRADDEEKAIRKRLSIFHAMTQPILAMMKADGILVEVDGEKPIEGIFKEITRAVTG